MDKYVKLEAIKAIAKPMAAFHGKGEGKMYGMEANKMEGKMHGKGEYTEGGSDWECPDCGTMVMATKDVEEMECPCCGCEMEPAEDYAEGETED
jgi:rubrerythrin